MPRVPGIFINTKGVSIMETENKIIQNYAGSLMDATNVVFSTTTQLADNKEENDAIIKTLNVLVESVRSQTVILQQAIDKYISG